MSQKLFCDPEVSSMNFEAFCIFPEFPCIPMPGLYSHGRVWPGSEGVISGWGGNKAAVLGGKNKTRLIL